jgi:hypothetical protein
MPIDRLEAEPEQGHKFDPRAYTPEDLAVIEQELKLTLAGASTPTEPEVIPPGARSPHRSLALTASYRFAAWRVSGGLPGRWLGSHRNRAALWLLDPLFRHAVRKLQKRTRR